jgi:uncharacterized protein
MATESPDEIKSGSPAACPICRKPAVPAYRPFCSKRCADVDLQRWFTGRYAIPVVEDEDGPDEPSDEDGAGQGGRGSL